MNDQYRIGVIVPSSNPVVEPFFSLLNRGVDGVSFFTSRLAVERIDLDAASARQFREESIAGAALQLSQIDLDAVVWAGTSGSWLGAEHEQRIVHTLETVLEVPATTATLGLIEACNAFSVGRVHLVTPYVEAIVARIVANYAALGIETVSERHLGIRENRKFADVTGDVLEELVEQADPRAQAALICCTNLRGTPLVADLERRNDRPIFDSVAAAYWSVLCKVDPGYSMNGAGMLLLSGGVRERLQHLSGGLLEEVGADRVTVRADVQSLGCFVDRACGEVTAPGVTSIAHDASLDQRGLETIRWLESTKTPLIQERFDRSPFPPQALLDIYGVAAQMLGPIIVEGSVVGWISVHQTKERSWRARDVTALENACDRARAIIFERARLDQ